MVTLVLWKYSLSLLQSKPRLNPSLFKTSRQDVCVQSMQSSQLGRGMRWHLTGERCDGQQNQPLNSAKRQVEVNMQPAVALWTWSCNEAHTEDELYLRMLYKKFCRKSCAKGSFPGALRGLRLEGLEVVGDWVTKEEMKAEEEKNGNKRGNSRGKAALQAWITKQIR